MCWLPLFGLGAVMSCELCHGSASESQAPITCTPDYKPVQAASQPVHKTCVHKVNCRTRVETVVLWLCAHKFGIAAVAKTYVQAAHCLALLQCLYRLLCLTQCEQCPIGRACLCWMQVWCPEQCARAIVVSGVHYVDALAIANCVAQQCDGSDSCLK